MTVEVSRSDGKKPKIATFAGTKFATSTQLSQRIITMLAQPDWPALPVHTAEWLHLQRRVSRMPQAGRLLIESFPHEGREHACIYGFAGRNAQQTLGLLLSKRMEELGLDPLGFVATDYATLIWGLEPLMDAGPLFDAEALRDGLDSWLTGNAVMKRTFRASATIAGLIQRNLPQARKSGRQATFSSDILYDTLVKYDPDHLLLRITRQEAMRGLVDFGRIEEMIARIGDRIDLMRLPRVTPLAAPLFLEAGRTPVSGAGEERLLSEEADRLMREAGLAQTS
ncbi:MAG: DNA ligase-associated DEXH box helicase, partial [Roseovarius sp.]